ncbi:MAG TPA: DUF488 domain-containing protein [Phycisphaerales bacterium]|nr:DUF488 domain-containing protein [Phycisphaerales bacterium]
MEVFTIGFAGRSAGRFFGDLRTAGVARLIDVRLNNTSQLAGFTKHADLPFFLKELCGAAYIHEPLLAPTREMLDAYKKHGGDWAEYERRFLDLMADRQIERTLDRALFSTPTVLLCSENTARHCHRRLVLEYLKNHWADVSVKHL